jgi:hypothetical protein
MKVGTVDDIEWNLLVRELLQWQVRFVVSWAQRDQVGACRTQN